MDQIINIIQAGVINMKNDKILKLLRLTQSTNDNEALSAIRMVNKNIDSWDNLFKNTGNSNDSIKIQHLQVENLKFQNQVAILKREIITLKQLQPQAQTLNTQIMQYTTIIRSKDVHIAALNAQLDQRDVESAIVGQLIIYYNLPWYKRIFTKRPKLK